MDNRPETFHRQGPFTRTVPADQGGVASRSSCTVLGLACPIMLTLEPVDLAGSANQ